MKDITVRVQVIKIYDVKVKADDYDEAISIVNGLRPTAIEDGGRLIDAMTDHIEIVDNMFLKKRLLM